MSFGKCTTCVSRNMIYPNIMRKVDCPVSAEDLRRLYLDEKLADPAIVERLGKGATLKRVRAWRKRFGIETISPSERNDVPPIDGSLRSLLVGSMLGDGGLNRQPNSTRYMENHADNQREYLEWKQAQWGSWDQVGSTANLVDTSTA